MKKIFTFLFFAGLMTTAMAQNDRYSQQRNQNGDNRTQNTTAAGNQGYGQAGNSYGQPAQGNNAYNRNNGYQQNAQVYNNSQNTNVYGNDRRYDDRGNDRRFRDNDHFDHRDYGYDRRKEYERYDRGRVNARVVIRFGQPSCF